MYTLQAEFKTLTEHLESIKQDLAKQRNHLLEQQQLCAAGTVQSIEDLLLDSCREVGYTGAEGAEWETKKLICISEVSLGDGDEL